MPRIRRKSSKRKYSTCDKILIATVQVTEILIQFLVFFYENPFHGAVVLFLVVIGLQKLYFKLEPRVDSFLVKPTAIIPKLGPQISGIRQKLPEEKCTLQIYNQNVQNLNSQNDPIFLFFQKSSRNGQNFFHHLFKMLSKHNHFRYLNLSQKIPTTRRDINHPDQIAEILSQTNCSQVSQPLLVADHHIWVNLTDKFNLPQPKFITFVRNPIQEFISEYYFCRFGVNKMPENRTLECGESTKMMSDQRLLIDLRVFLKNFGFEQNFG